MRTKTPKPKPRSSSPSTVGPSAGRESEKGWSLREAVAFMDGAELGRKTGYQEGCWHCFAWVIAGYLIGWGLAILYKCAAGPDRGKE